MYKKISAILFLPFFVLVFLSAVGGAEDKIPPSQDYNAEQIYAGRYLAEGVFMRRSVQKAYAPHHALARLEQVNCRDAQDSLARQGRWKGNLKTNGACGDPGDPADWVTGNYLNYLAGR